MRISTIEAKGSFGFCSSVRQAQMTVREAIVEFLGSPSTASFGLLCEAGSRYVKFEREVLLAATARLLDADSLQQLHRNHNEFVRALDAVQSAVPGSQQLDEHTLRLRHAFLAQVGHCETSVFPVLSVSTRRSP